METTPELYTQDDLLKRIKDGMKIPEQLSKQLEQHEAEI